MWGPWSIFSDCECHAKRVQVASAKHKVHDLDDIEISLSESTLPCPEECTCGRSVQKGIEVDHHVCGKRVVYRTERTQDCSGTTKFGRGRYTRIVTTHFPIRPSFRIARAENNQVRPLGVSNQLPGFEGAILEFYIVPERVSLVHRAMRRNMNDSASSLTFQPSNCAASLAVGSETDPFGSFKIRAISVVSRVAPERAPPE